MLTSLWDEARLYVRLGLAELEGLRWPGNVAAYGGGMMGDTSPLEGCCK